MLKQTISISRCLIEIAVVAPFCITKPRKKTSSGLNIRNKSWKGLIKFILGDLWPISLNFEIITLCQFHNEPYIFHGSWLIKQLTLPLQQHYLNSFLIKLRRKNDDLAPNVETVFRHIFPDRNLQFLPHGNPRNLFSNTRILLLATHSF